MFFKNYLHNLTKFQTFQLYTLIAIAILYPYTLLLDLNDEKNIYDNKNILNLKKDIETINKKLEIPDFIKVIKNFENEALKYKTLKIENFTTSNKSIKLNGLAREDELLNFLLFCENYSNTSSLNSLQFKVSDKPQFYSFSFNIEFKKIYMKTISNKELKEQTEKISLLTKTSKNTLKLQGIIDKNVIINNKLLAINETIDGFKIEKILSNQVILSNGPIKKVLSLKGNSDGK